MKKNSFKIILVILFILLVLFLGYDSFNRVSYSRQIIDNYSFMLPKNIEFEVVYDEGKLYSDDIIESSIVVYNSNFNNSLRTAKSYTFYSGSVDILDEYQDAKMYRVFKKVKYFDTNDIDYVVTYVYDLSDGKVFVLTYECKDEAITKNLMKEYDVVVKSVSLY